MIPFGWLIPLPVAVPNIAWALFPSPRAPVPAARHVAPEPRLLVLVERIGRVGSFVVPCFLDVHLTTVTDHLCLGVAILALAIYDLGWVRYFLRGRAPVFLYRPLAGMPVPLAMAPVAYFLACSVLARSFSLAFVAVALAVAHVPLSLRRAKALQITERDSRNGTPD